jgi:hypothetical protein
VTLATASSISLGCVTALGLSVINKVSERRNKQNDYWVLLIMA